MYELWTFTENWGSFPTGRSVYPNAHLTSVQFRGLRESGKLVRASAYKPKARVVKPDPVVVATDTDAPAARVPKVTKPRAISAEKKESVDE